MRRLQHGHQLPYIPEHAYQKYCIRCVAQQPDRSAFTSYTRIEPHFLDAVRRFIAWHSECGTKAYVHATDKHIGLLPRLGDKPPVVIAVWMAVEPDAAEDVDRAARALWPDQFPDGLKGQANFSWEVGREEEQAREFQRMLGYFPPTITKADGTWKEPRPRVIVLLQYAGQQMHAPPGYIHLFRNIQPCFMIAYDVIDPGHYHLYMASHRRLSHLSTNPSDNAAVTTAMVGAVLVTAKILANK